MILKKKRRTQEVLQRLPQGQDRCQGAGPDRGADQGQGAGTTILLMMSLGPGVDPGAGTTTLLMIPHHLRLLASPPHLEELAAEEEEEEAPLTLHLVKSLLTFPQYPRAS